jgi:hypothetical protein
MDSAPERLEGRPGRSLRAPRRSGSQLRAQHPHYIAEEDQIQKYGHRHQNDQDGGVGGLVHPASGDIKIFRMKSFHIITHVEF